MSEHEDFKAWLKTWALPGNTTREDAMYAAWQARAARTAPSALQSENERLIQLVTTLMKDSETLEGECNAWLAKDAETNRQLAENHNERKALQAEVQRLTKQIEEGLPRLMQQCHDLRAERDALKSEAQFLIERLNSLEFTDMDDLVRDWYGHVVPSFSRLQALTAKPEVDHECTCPSGDGSLRWPCPKHKPEVKS